jgi:hypothetical protein
MLLLLGTDATREPCNLVLGPHTPINALKKETAYAIGPEHNSDL